MSFTALNLPHDVTVAVDDNAGPVDAAEIPTSASDTLVAALAAAKGVYLKDLAAFEVQNTSDYRLY